MLKQRSGDENMGEGGPSPFSGGDAAGRNGNGRSDARRAKGTEGATESGTIEKGTEGRTAADPQGPLFDGYDITGPFKEASGRKPGLDYKTEVTGEALVRLHSAGFGAGHSAAEGGKRRGEKESTRKKGSRNILANAALRAMWTPEYRTAVENFEAFAGQAGQEYDEIHDRLDKLEKELQTKNEELGRRTIMVNGRKIYVGADGNYYYAGAEQPITDQAIIDEAQSQHQTLGLQEAATVAENAHLEALASEIERLRADANASEQQMNADLAAAQQGQGGSAADVAAAQAAAQADLETSQSELDALEQKMQPPAVAPQIEGPSNVRENQEPLTQSLSF